MALEHTGHFGIQDQGSSFSQKRRILVGGLVGATLAWWAGIEARKNLKNKRDISNQKLVFSETLWWIDLGHANPKGAIELLQNVKQPIQIPKNPHYWIVKYSQKQRMWPVSSWVTKEFLVPLKLNPIELEAVAFTIFLSVSRAFESHQEYTDWFSNSAYSEPDIIGNIIGFYRASRGYSLDEIRALLQVKSVQEALKVYGERSIRKNDAIGRVPCTNDPDTFLCKYPPPFNSIRTIRLWKFYHGRILLQEIHPRNTTSQLEFLWYTSTWLEKFRVKNPKSFFAWKPKEQAEFVAELGEKYKKAKWLRSENPQEIIVYF